jgi:hypothetical protein
MAESDYEFALNVERVLHRRMLNDETFHKGAARIANPKWKLISLEEQEFIMSTIHIECECRQLVDRSIHQEPVVDKKETIEPVTESHTLPRDWNEMILPKSVSDNSPVFMSEQHLGEEYDEFQEILD